MWLQGLLAPDWFLCHMVVRQLSSWPELYVWTPSSHLRRSAEIKNDWLFHNYLSELHQHIREQKTVLGNSLWPVRKGWISYKTNWNRRNANKNTKNTRQWYMYGCISDTPFSRLGMWWNGMKIQFLPHLQTLLNNQQTKRLFDVMQNLGMDPESRYLVVQLVLTTGRWLTQPIPLWGSRTPRKTWDLPAVGKGPYAGQPVRRILN